MHRSWSFIAVSLLFVLSFLAGSARADNVLFQDHFNTDGPLSSEWKNVKGSHWVQGGMLYSQQQSGTLDSGLVTHDGDSTWTDYRVSATLDPYQGMASLLFRTNDTSPYAGPGLHMNGYRLILSANATGDGNLVELHHINGNNTGYRLARIEPSSVLNGSNHVEVLLDGSRIQVWLNSTPIIDLVDSSPVLSGGVGVQSVWTNTSRYDDVVVTSVTPVPLPASWAMGLVGLAALKVIGRKRASAAR